MITDEQFARLPLYARNEIDRLRGQLRHAEARLAASSIDDAPISYGFRDANGLVGVPWEPIRFSLFNGEIHVTLEAQRKRLSIRGTTLVDIRPSAANSFDVSLAR